MIFQSLSSKISEYEALQRYLSENGQASYEAFLHETFSKYLLISCASMFEDTVQDLISEFIAEHTDSEMVQSLVKNKVIKRQYHTFFKWDGKNANSFYGLFGDKFSKRIQEKLKNNDALKDGEEAFLAIGEARNQLVHDNFSGYALDKNIDDIITLFKQACTYIDFLKEELIPPKFPNDVLRNF